MSELLPRGGTVHALADGRWVGDSSDDTGTELAVLDGDVVYDGR